MKMKICSKRNVKMYQDSKLIISDLIIYSKSEEKLFYLQNLHIKTQIIFTRVRMVISLRP